MPQSQDALDRSTIRLAAALAAGVLLLAAMVSNAVATAASERTGAAVAVDAVVLEDAPGAGTARLAWTERDGSAGVATAAVPAGTQAGETRRLWVAPDGAVVPQPPAGSGPWVAGLLTALAGIVVGAAVVVAHSGARRRSRDRDLTLEWARVEPLWTGREA